MYLRLCTLLQPLQAAAPAMGIDAITWSAARCVEQLQLLLSSLSMSSFAVGFAKHNSEVVT